MENSRRSFLKIAGVSALGLGLAKKTISAAGAKAKHHSGQAKQWGMVIDTRRFHSANDLKPITEACIKSHNIPRIDDKKSEIKWIWEEKYHHVFPDLTSKYVAEKIEHRPIPALCNHCENPPCVRPCPTQATFKRKDGIVAMDFHRCIGCRCCMAGCPYGARSFNYFNPRPKISEKDYNPQFPTRMQGVVEKCNFCVERISVGKQPACVEAARGAIVFGNLADPQSEIRQVLKTQFTIRRKTGLGTEPSVFYIL